MHSERGATLTPAINATVWEQGVSTRLVLFQDWIWQGKKLASVLIAGLQKVDGKTTPDVVQNVVGFQVEPVRWLRSPRISADANLYVGWLGQGALRYDAAFG